MPYLIENLTERPVLFLLSTGEELRLAPRETSSEFKELEVKNNPKIQKLMDRRVIALHEMRGQKKTPAPAKIEEKKKPIPGSSKEK